MNKIQSRLSSAPINTKILFTLFLSFIACAFVIGMLSYYDRTGFSYDRTVRYYHYDEYNFDPFLLFYPEGIDNHEEDELQTY